MKDTFVAFSEIEVPQDGSAGLEQAFARRLGLVERWPGFVGLQVWKDRGRAGSYAMVSWWSSKEQFDGYMASVDHRTSHARVPTGPNRARPAHFRRYEVVAE